MSPMGSGTVRREREQLCGQWTQIQGCCLFQLERSNFAYFEDDSVNEMDYSRRRCKTDIGDAKCLACLRAVE